MATTRKHTSRLVDLVAAEVTHVLQERAALKKWGNIADLSRLSSGAAAQVNTAPDSKMLAVLERAPCNNC